MESPVRRLGDLLDKAIGLGKRQRFEEAVAAAEEAKDHAEASFGLTSVAYVSSLQVTGRMLADAGRLQRAPHVLHPARPVDRR